MLEIYVHIIFLWELLISQNFNQINASIIISHQIASPIENPIESFTLYKFTSFTRLVKYLSKKYFMLESHYSHPQYFYKIATISTPSYFTCQVIDQLVQSKFLKTSTPFFLKFDQSIIPFVDIHEFICQFVWDSANPKGFNPNSRQNLNNRKFE